MSRMSHPCVLCRKRKEKHRDLVFHAFPKNKERCLKWVSVLKVPDLQGRTIQQLNSSSKVCSDHFSPRNYVAGKPQSKLCHYACPDENLEVETIGTSCTAAVACQTEGRPNPNKVAKASSIDYVASANPPINIDTIAGMEMTFGSVNTSIDENVSGVGMIAMHSPDKQKIRNPFDFSGSSLGEVIEVKEESFEFTQEATEVAEEDPLMVKNTEAGFSTSSFTSHCGDAFGLNSRNAEKNNSLRTEEVSIKDEPIESEDDEMEEKKDKSNSSHVFLYRRQCDQALQ